MAAPVVVASVEQVLVAALAQLMPSASVGTRTPSDLVDHLPWIRPTMISGARTPVDSDYSNCDVDTFTTADDDAATQLAAQVEAALLATRNLQLPTVGAELITVGSIMRPHWEAWDNTGVLRYVASYRVRTAPIPVA
jgi:hypothetical protein